MSLSLHVFLIKLCFFQTQDTLGAPAADVVTLEHHCQYRLALSIIKQFILIPRPLGLQLVMEYNTHICELLFSCFINQLSVFNKRIVNKIHAIPFCSYILFMFFCGR